MIQTILNKTLCFKNDFGSTLKYMQHLITFIIIFRFYCRKIKTQLTILIHSGYIPRILFVKKIILKKGTLFNAFLPYKSTKIIKYLVEFLAYSELNFLHKRYRRPSLFAVLTILGIENRKNCEYRGKKQSFSLICA